MDHTNAQINILQLLKMEWSAQNKTNHTFN